MKFKKQIFLLGLALTLISCSYGQKIIHSIKPTLVYKNQYVYHYTSQKDLDTLKRGFFLANKKRSINFYLENPNSDYAQDTIIETWNAKRIQEFENQIAKTPTFTNISLREQNKLGRLFSEYCKQGEMKDRLPTVKYFSEKSNNTANDILTSSSNSFSYSSPLNYFMLYGNDSIQKETIKIIIQRIPRISPYDFSEYAPFLVNENSNSYYTALTLLQKNIDTIQDRKKHMFNLVNYLNYVAPEVARVGGKRAVSSLLKTIDFIFKNESELYVSEYFNKDLETVFILLYKFHKIDPKTHKKISNQLKKYGIDINELIQNNTLINYQLDLNTLVAKAKRYGLLTTNLSKNQAYQIARDYVMSSYNIKISDFLKNISVTFSFESTHFGSGHLVAYSTPNYDGIMDKHMIAALADIPNYYTESYLYKTNAETPNYALFLGDEKEGFVINTTDKTLADFDYKAVSHLFNALLKHKNIEKRFTIKENTAQKRYEVVYAKPNALDSFISSFRQKEKDTITINSINIYHKVDTIYKTKSKPIITNIKIDKQNNKPLNGFYKIITGQDTYFITRYKNGLEDNAIFNYIKYYANDNLHRIDLKGAKTIGYQYIRIPIFNGCTNKKIKAYFVESDSDIITESIEIKIEKNKKHVIVKTYSKQNGVSQITLALDIFADCN